MFLAHLSPSYSWFQSDHRHQDIIRLHSPFRRSSRSPPTLPFRQWSSHPTTLRILLTSTDGWITRPLHPNFLPAIPIQWQRSAVRDQSERSDQGEEGTRGPKCSRSAARCGRTWYEWAQQSSNEEFYLCGKSKNFLPFVICTCRGFLFKSHCHFLIRSSAFYFAFSIRNVILVKRSDTEWHPPLRCCRVIQQNRRIFSSRSNLVCCVQNIVRSSCTLLLFLRS